MLPETLNRTTSQEENDSNFYNIYSHIPDNCISVVFCGFHSMAKKES